MSPLSKTIPLPHRYRPIAVADLGFQEGGGGGGPKLEEHKVLCIEPRFDLSWGTGSFCAAPYWDARM